MTKKYFKLFIYKFLYLSLNIVAFKIVSKGELF